MQPILEVETQHKFTIKQIKWYYKLEKSDVLKIENLMATKAISIAL